MGKSGLQGKCTFFLKLGKSFSKQINDKVANELMGIAYDNGINFFDNAEVYALGESEKKWWAVSLKEKLGSQKKKKNIP